MSEPVTRRQARDSGRSDHQLDADLRAGRLVAVHRGIHMTRLPGSVAERCRAALVTQPAGAVVSHRTAAVLLGLPWLPTAWADAQLHVDLTVPVTDTRRERPSIRLRRYALSPEDIVVVHGVPTTTPARTVLDLVRSRDADRLLGLQLADGVLRFSGVTPDDLAAALARLTGSRGVKRARETARLARPGVASPKETQLRLVLIDGGVPEDAIDVDIELRDEDGLVLARGDLGSKRLMVWGEYDGLDAHTQRRQFNGDRFGDRMLEGRGWQPMRFSEDDFARAYWIVQHYKDALRRAPARILAMDADRSPELARAQAALIALRGGRPAGRSAFPGGQRPRTVA